MQSQVEDSGLVLWCGRCLHHCEPSVPLPVTCSTTGCYARGEEHYTSALWRDPCLATELAKTVSHC